jgi:hypothetical protein
VRNRAPALVTKARSDETGMQAICGDARAVQPSGELTRKYCTVSSVLMRPGGRADDARGSRRYEPLAQPLCQGEIGHVVERACEFKPVRSKPAAGKERACIIDQDVDTLLPVSDFSRHAFHLGEACEISKIDGVGALCLEGAFFLPTAIPAEVNVDAPENLAIVWLECPSPSYSRPKPLTTSEG